MPSSAGSLRQLHEWRKSRFPSGMTERKAKANTEDIAFAFLSVIPEGNLLLVIAFLVCHWLQRPKESFRCFACRMNPDGIPAS